MLGIMVLPFGLPTVSSVSSQTTQHRPLCRWLHRPSQVADVSSSGAPAGCPAALNRCITNGFLMYNLLENNQLMTILHIYIIYVTYVHIFIVDKDLGQLSNDGSLSVQLARLPDAQWPLWELLQRLVSRLGEKAG